MDQIPIDRAIESVKEKYHTEQSRLRSLPEWLRERDPSDYRERKQTHEAWVEVCRSTLDWLCDVRESQDSISKRKFLNRKREDLREVLESGDYPHSDLPDPMPLID